MPDDRTVDCELALAERDEARSLSHEGLDWAIRMGKGGLASICDPDELRRFADYCYRAERLPSATKREE